MNPEQGQQEEIENQTEETAEAQTAEAEVQPDVGKVKGILDGIRERDESVVDSTEAESTEAVSEETAESKPEDKTAAPASADAYSPEILQAARGVGLTDGAARGFGSPADLLSHIHNHPTYKAWATENLKQQSQGQTGFKMDDIDFGDDELDPRIVTMSKNLKAMNEYFGGRMQDIESSMGARMSQWEQQHQAAENERSLTWFTQQVKALPSELSEALSDDRQLDMAHYIASRETGLNALVQGGAKLSIPSREDLFKESVKVFLGDKIAEIERNKISKTLQTQQSTLTTRPTQRNRPELGVEEASLSKVRDTLQSIRDRQGVS